MQEDKKVGFKRQQTGKSLTGKISRIGDFVASPKKSKNGVQRQPTGHPKEAMALGALRTRIRKVEEFRVGGELDASDLEDDEESKQSETEQRKQKQKQVRIKRQQTGMLAKNNHSKNNLPKELEGKCSEEGDQD